MCFVSGACLYFFRPFSQWPLPSVIVYYRNLSYSLSSVIYLKLSLYVQSSPNGGPLEKISRVKRKKNKETKKQQPE